MIYPNPNKLEMRSAGGLSSVFGRPQEIGATFFAKFAKIYFIRHYTFTRVFSIQLRITVSEIIP